MHLKLHKIWKIFAKNGFPRCRTVETVFRKYFANLGKPLVHSLIKMKHSPMRSYWLQLHSTILKNMSSRRKRDRTLVMNISTAGHCTYHFSFLPVFQRFRGCITVRPKSSPASGCKLTTADRSRIWNFLPTPDSTLTPDKTVVTD